MRSLLLLHFRRLHKASSKVKFTLGRTASCTVIVGKRSGTVHRAGRAGMSASSVSRIAGWPSAAYTATPDERRALVTGAPDGNNCLMFCSLVGRRSTARRISCFLQLIREKILGIVSQYHCQLNEDNLSSAGYPEAGYTVSRSRRGNPHIKRL